MLTFHHTGCHWLTYHPAMPTDRHTLFAERQVIKLMTSEAEPRVAHQMANA